MSWRDKSDSLSAPPQASRLTDLLVLDDAAALERRVSCETCPVSLSCLLGEGGSGFTFEQCCGSTTIYLDKDAKPPKILIVDCGKHGFERDEDLKRVARCPLCSGGIMEVEARGKGDQWYLATVHAGVDLPTRLKLFREKHAEAKAKLAAVEAEEAAVRAKAG